MMRVLVLLLCAVVVGCATPAGPLRDTPGYAAIEACDTAGIDFAAALQFSGCFEVVRRAAGEDDVAMPGGVVRLLPLMANKSGCDPNVGCAIPLSTTEPFMVKATQRWWTPLSGNLLYLLWSDGYVATRMCLRRVDDQLIGDVGRVNLVDNAPAQGRGSIVLKRATCD